MKKNSILIFMALTLAMLSSCSSKKNFLYLQDMYPEVEYIVNNRPEALIKRGDRLSIVVTAKDPALALPYNLNVASIQVEEGGEINANEKKTTVTSEKGYRVNADGNIEFPVLGFLHVEGLTLTQLTNMIKEKLVVGGHLKEPIVLVDFINFKYYTLGALSPGVHTVEDDRINLIEAIAAAGDLNEKAKLDRILVIRENGDKRQVYVTDLRSKDIFDSPAFYLQQNDIIYAEPRYRKREPEQNLLYYMSLILSPIMTFSTLYVLLKKDRL